jgi:hypothetical protein
MNTKDAYKQKIEAELELVKAELEVLRTKAKSTTGDMRIVYNKEIETIENNYTIVQSKLHELSGLGEVTWEHLKKDIDNSWNSLRAYAKETPHNISEIKKNIK